MAADEWEKWLKPDHLRLHAGELTAQELRTVQAVVRAMLAELRASGVPVGAAGPVMRPISDKEIEQIAGRDELTGDAILDFAHRLLTAAANPAAAGVAVPRGGEQSEGRSE